MDDLLPNQATDEPKGIFHRIPRALRFIFLGYMTFIVLIAVLVAPFTDYAYKLEFSNYNILFLIGGILLALAAIALTHGIHGLMMRRTPGMSSPKRVTHPNARFAIFVVIGCIILFAVKCWITAGGYYRGNNGDPSLLTGGILNLIGPKLPDLTGKLTLFEYLGTFPNNQTIAGIFYVIERIATGMGINVFFALDIVACALCAIVVGLTAAIGRTLAGKIAGVWCFILAALFIGLSPWSFIPYSDSYGLIFPVLVMFLYVCVHHPSRWAFMVFLTGLGYYIKPTLIAPFAAILLVQGCRALAQRRTKQARGSEGQRSSKIPMRSIAEIGISCTVALVLALGCVYLLKGSYGMPPQDPEREFPAAHWLNMGANEDTWGTWSQEDEDATKAQGTKAEKTAYNVRSWQERIGRLGIPGVANLLLQKSLVNCTQGDFHWPQARYAKAFFLNIYGDNPAVQEFYGIEDRSGKDFLVHEEDPDWTPPPWSYLAQLLWMLTLAGVVLNWLRKRPSAAELAMSIAALLLCGFLLVFESDGRYLYVFAPFFCVLSVLGWQALARCFFARKERSSTDKTLGTLTPRGGDAHLCQASAADDAGSADDLDRGHGLTQDEGGEHHRAQRLQVAEDGHRLGLHLAHA